MPLKTGTYKELLQQDGAFADFLKTHSVSAGRDRDALGVVLFFLGSYVNDASELVLCYLCYQTVLVKVQKALRCLD